MALEKCSFAVEINIVLFVCFGEKRYSSNICGVSLCILVGDLKWLISLKCVGVIEG